ncbi:MAG: tRNA (adenosine(37)-N6)-threonylcarbamoyltransferase complex ATPase subunit type 1 TsaE [Bdellovibrionaceae bacterium]|nr:tRNA (adenosine(37)-N6)-threonylcarbamoyltransferase complex ATPase subunit type 1 TsaE [Pseudobdellovibrionaceae bacterium]
MELHSAEKELKDHLGLFFDSLKVGDIVLLRADLGMGKTTLVRNFVEDRFAKIEKDTLFVETEKDAQLTEIEKNTTENRFTQVGEAAKPNLRAVQFSSPSYNLIQEYKLKNYTIYHIDLYRLEDEDQIASVGLWDVLDDPKSIIFIEWAERIDPEDLPNRPTYEIKITHPDYVLEDTVSALDDEPKNKFINESDGDSQNNSIHKSDNGSKKNPTHILESEDEFLNDSRQYTITKINSPLNF